MSSSRRDLLVSLSALAAARAGAQAAALPSKIYSLSDPNRPKQVMKGETHSGYALEVHVTELDPGKAPHPPHHHVHEEMLVLHEGTLDVMIAGKTRRINAGSVVYVASGEEHGWSNAGDTKARYFVFELGQNT